MEDIMEKQQSKLFLEEVTHLSKIYTKLSAALKDAESSVNRIDKDYMDVKHYMADYRGEIDPHEMLQNNLALHHVNSSGAFAVKLKNKIAKLKESPYFARIDFRTQNNEESSKYYIGRFAFNYNNELLILDWRAPIASIFYDCEVGPASYVAACGQINGELTRKRQFKIKDGEMEYVLETSENIQDDVLQRELSHTSDEKMKSIISTIQKEQNLIIRNEKVNTLIIQGVAGSGKTSIALHRIAFLLYRFKDNLSADNVSIISPNKVFGDYISNVLPELGEEPIYEVSFSDIAEAQLGKVIKFELDKNPLEIDDAGWSSRVQFKSTLDFKRKMDEYISKISNLIDITDYSYEPFSATSEWIRSRLDAYKKFSLMERLTMIANDIYDQFNTSNIMEHEVPKPRTILKNLKAMLRFKNTLALYKDFYKQMDMSKMLVMPNSKTLEWNDVFPFLYLHAAFMGLKENKMIRHLVIDEMQDYTPIQYAVINILFKCEKTILGDFAQSLNCNYHNSLEDLQQLYNNAEFVHLNKSYRSTFEIMNFAKQIQPVNDLEAIERHGKAPEIIQCKSKHDEINKLLQLINLFFKSDFNTMGIITKTNDDARELYDELKEKYQVNLLTPESERFETGVTIASVRMSKGLEFDEVIVIDVDNKTYSTDYDSSLLYVACTRAMHCLTLLYSGEKSFLLP